MPWAEMLYWATVVFGRTREQFLDMVPIELFALIEVHNMVNEPDEKKRKQMADGRRNPKRSSVVPAAVDPSVFAMLARQRIHG